MSNTIYHNHHIIPRHAGGTDDPSNLVKLTIEQHAEEHRKLYEQYGRWQDNLAHRALSGMISNQEALLESMSHKGERNPMYGKKHPEERIERMRECKVGDKNPFYGKKHSNETLSIMREKAVKSEAWKADMSNKMKGRVREKIACPHCSKTGGAGVMNRWHFDNCKMIG